MQFDLILTEDRLRVHLLVEQVDLSGLPETRHSDLLRPSLPPS